MTALRLTIEPDRPDPTRLDRLTGQLFREVRALGGFLVDRPAGEPPPGAKSGAAASIGELVVSGVLSAGSVSALAGVLVAWVKRTGARSVTVKRDGQEYTLTALSADDQRALIDWLTTGPAADPAAAPDSPEQR